MELFFQLVEKEIAHRMVCANAYNSYEGEDKAVYFEQYIKPKLQTMTITPKVETKIMLQMTGKVVNTFTQDGGQDKDGKDYDARHKVQLLGEFDLPNGDVKHDLVDLKVDDLKDWTPYKGKDVTIDIGVYAPSKGTVIYFIKKGSKPQLKRLGTE